MLPKRFHHHHARLPLCEMENPFLGGEAVRMSQETDVAFIIQIPQIPHLWSEPSGSLEHTFGNPSSEPVGSCHFIHTERTCLWPSPHGHNSFHLAL